MPPRLRSAARKKEEEEGQEGGALLPRLLGYVIYVLMHVDAFFDRSIRPSNNAPP